jgi:hypothetical protein
LSISFPKKQTIDILFLNVFVESMIETSKIFFVITGNFVKLFCPVESSKKQIKGKIKSKNNTTLFFDIFMI